MRKFLAPFVLAAVCFGGCSEPPQATSDKEGAKQAKSSANAGPGATDADKGSSSQELVDPEWFSAELIEHAAVLQDSTSETRDDGGYSRAILLELDAGTEPAACMDTLEKALKGKLTLEERTAGDDGRVMVRGKKGVYALSLVCGANKDGKPSAYLGLSVDP